MTERLIIMDPLRRTDPTDEGCSYEKDKTYFIFVACGCRIMHFDCANDGGQHVL